MSDLIIKMRHVRAAKMCGPGIRPFFTKYKLDLNDFLKNGISEQKLLATNDAIVLEVIKAAKNDK